MCYVCKPSGGCDVVALAVNVIGSYFSVSLQDEGAEWPGEEREALRRARTGNKDRCWRHGMCGCTVGDKQYRGNLVCVSFKLARRTIHLFFGRSEDFFNSMG